MNACRQPPTTFAGLASAFAGGPFELARIGTRSDQKAWCRKELLAERNAVDCLGRLPTRDGFGCRRQLHPPNTSAWGPVAGAWKTLHALGPQEYHGSRLWNAACVASNGKTLNTFIPHGSDSH